MKQRLTLTLMALAFLLPARAVDPTLTASVVAQTAMLNEQYNKRKRLHERVIVAQGAVALAVENVHQVEDRMLSYLGNASALMDNLQELKDIYELVGVDIPRNLIALGRDIPNNIKGTALTMFINGVAAETVADITALSSTVNRLCTSRYNFKDSKDKDDPNINLLSAGERYYILSDVHKRLNDINRRLWLSNYFIKSFTWQGLWRGLDRESWAKAVYSQMVVKTTINHWKVTFGKEH